MEKEEGERVEKIEHFSHPHPLVLVLNDKSKEGHCSACLESLFGPSFRCEECDEFHLHKSCAEAPSQITHSPYDRKHPTLTLKTKVPSYFPYSCDWCKDTRQMFVYLCPSCVFCLDIKCAFQLHNIDEINFRELKYVGHEHPLTFIEINPSDDQVKRADCYWCQKPVVDLGYVCSTCRFYLHKKCARLPAQVYHPSHRKHPLYVEDANLVCRLCEKEHWSFFYRCLPCKFDIDIECVLSRPWSCFEHKSNHEHLFNLLLRPGTFICDACGIEGNYFSYICSICHIMIHKKCISLPRIIKTTRHHHYVIHNYFFQKEKLENQECGICLSIVDMEYGSYSCWKPDCNYVSHVNCAMEIYDIIDHVNYEDEESSEYLAMNSSITCVVEMNEHGEATKVKHFSHEHDLTLGNKMKEDDDKRCDGCMLSISTTILVYCCSQCEFHLHKSCAELPRKKHHWFHRSLTTLESVEFFKCHLCISSVVVLLTRVTMTAVKISVYGVLEFLIPLTVKDTTTLSFSILNSRGNAVLVAPLVE